MNAQALSWQRAALRVQFSFLLFVHLYRKANFNPDQPRDELGKWTDGSDDGDLAQSLKTAKDQSSRSDLPDLQNLANSPEIRSQIDTAWRASNPKESSPQEHGFWICRDETTGEVSTRPFANPGQSASMVPGEAPKNAIAFFHTHPNKEGYIPEPSAADQAFAARVGLPGLIQSHSGMYYFGPALSRHNDTKLKDKNSFWIRDGAHSNTIHGKARHVGIKM